MIERRAGFCTAFFSKIEGEQMEQGKSRLAQEFEKKEEGRLVRLNNTSVKPVFAPEEKQTG